MDTKTTNNEACSADLPQLAKRRWRLAAVIVDTILAMLVALPVMMYFDFWQTIQNGAQPAIHVVVVLFLWSTVSFLVMNYWLLEHRGQTIGKWCMDVAIVGMDGERKSAFHLITRRYLPLWAAAQTPMIGNLLTTLDSLFIFGKEKRCIHDHIAGTKVIRVES